MNPLIERLARRLVERGELRITDHHGEEHVFGDRSGKSVHIRFNDGGAERAIILDPALKLGECYMDGRLDMLDGSIFDLLELIFTNTGPHATSSAPWMRSVNLWRRIVRRYMQLNSVPKARQNVQRHYDLSGELYALFLDEDRQYSCAYFREPGFELDAAQQAKKEHIAAKLCLSSREHSVLDIGSGWGGLGLYLAETFGVDVTGVTLSDEQLRYSSERVPRRLQQRVRFQLKDFRAIEDKFDRIVSVGMFEHVGVPNYQTYFDTCARLLKKDGVMVLHSIGRADVPSWTNPFIAKYIFPGGYIPSLSEVLPHIERSGLYVTDVEILRLHYADTLKAWRQRFMKRRDEAKALYDERFCRMWEFYLAASESAFRWQNLMVFQIQLAHDQQSVPLTRDYITDIERQLAGSGAGQTQRRAG